MNMSFNVEQTSSEIGKKNVDSVFAWLRKKKIVHVVTEAHFSYVFHVQQKE